MRGTKKQGGPWAGRPLAAQVFGSNNILENAAHTMNAVTGIYAGVFAVGGAVAYAPGAIAWGIGHAYGLGGAGIAVLGTWPAYTELADAMGAKISSMPNWTYNTLEFFGEGWTANQAFLDEIVAQGDTIVTSGGVLDYGRTFATEIGYLTTTYGYQYVPGTGSIFPPH